MFFVNMQINIEPGIVSHLQNKLIEFDCDTLWNILAISNEGPRLFKVKIIPTIGDFMYDKVVAQYTNRLDFTPGAKIKSHNLLLYLRIFYRIIAHNILPKKKHHDEVTFMNICLIDCNIRGCRINLLYIMIKNIIMAHDHKQIFLSYG
jgi:hypothetical protein